MRSVFPILPDHAAAEVLASLTDSIAELERSSATSHPGATYPSVGSVVADSQIEHVQSLLRAHARQHGYPHSRGQALVRFDQSVAGPLHQAMDISPWLAAEEGLWAFMSLVVAPDVAVWRYPQRHPDRLLGGYRNVFRRLWWRAELLGNGVQDPPALMGEDQLVAVMERTDALGGDPRIARAFCSAVLRRQVAHPELPRMMLQRESAKWVTRVGTLRLLSALPEDELAAAMDGFVSVVAEALAPRSAT